MEKDREEQLIGFYDDVYKKKKEENIHLRTPSKRRMKRIDLYKRIIQKGHEQILEIGCGTGDLAYCLLNAADKVVGVDISREAVEIARSRFSFWDIDEKQLQRIQFKHSGIKLDFPDDTFDWVISTSVVEHLYPNDISFHFKEVLRVLKPHGFYLVWCPNALGHHQDRPGHVSMFSYEEWIRGMKKAGFVNIRSSLFNFSLLAPARFKVWLERLLCRLGMKVMWSHLGVRNVLLVGQPRGGPL